MDKIKERLAELVQEMNQDWSIAKLFASAEYTLLIDKRADYLEISEKTNLLGQANSEKVVSVRVRGEKMIGSYPDRFSEIVFGLRLNPRLRKMAESEGKRYETLCESQLKQQSSPYFP